jgi:hypothetical protein
MFEIVLNNKVKPNVYRDIGWLFNFVYFLLGWHASAVILPPGDAILAQPACPLKDVMFIYIWCN